MNDPVVDAVDAAIKAAYAATGRRSIITLVALAHAYAGWRESCLRDTRTQEIDPKMVALVAQVDALMAGMQEQYEEAAEAERVEGVITRAVDAHESVSRALRFTPTPRGDT